MFRLIGKKADGSETILDDQIPDDFAAIHDAEYCGQYYTGYESFRLESVEPTATPTVG